MVELMDQGLHYEVNGTGAPVLLIHGTGSSLRVWDPVVHLLAARRTVIAVDLPGFGFSPPMTSGPPPTPAGYARVLAELLRELGYDRAHVAGNSVGGWTALEAAKRLSWSEDFGKGSGQVYSLGGGVPQRSCNEVEVAKLLRALRPEAYWISGFAPSQIPDLWRPWVLGPAEAPAWLNEFDRRLRPRLSAPKGGMPDVVAWDPDLGLESALFVESKGPKENNKEAQEAGWPRP